MDVNQKPGRLGEYCSDEILQGQTGDTTRLPDGLNGLRSRESTRAYLHPIISLRTSCKRTAISAPAIIE